MISIVLICFALLLVIGVPVAHVILMSAAIGVLLAGNDGIIIAQQTVLGVNSFIILAVPFFIISGAIAAAGETAQRLVNLIGVFVNGIRGGLGIATIYGCAAFGAVSGSAIACVVAIGSLMYPKLLENGYPRPLAIGMITCAGTLGVLIPPSIPMLQIAIAMQTSVGDQFLAGFIPGIVAATILATYIYWQAVRHGVPMAPRASWDERLRMIRESFFAVMFPVIILGGIYSGFMTPTEAAAMSVLYVMLVELLIYGKLTIRDIVKIVQDNVVNAATLTLTIAVAQVFVWYLATERVPEKLYTEIVGSVTSEYTLWAALVGLFFFCGLFTNVATVVIILGPILLPVLNHFGIDLLQFGIVSVMMAEIGFVTPPFGLCLFVAAKITNTSLLQVAKACLPFIVIMLLTTMLFVLVPELSTFLPRLLAS